MAGLRLTQLKGGVFLDECREGWPSSGIQRLKCVEVNGQQLGIVSCSESANNFHQLLAGWGFGEGFHCAIFVVGDLEAVQEVAEKVFMGTYEPYLEDVCGHGVILTATDLLCKPSELVDAGFLFEKHGTQVSGFRQSF